MIEYEDNSKQVAERFKALGPRAGAAVRRALVATGAQNQRTATKELFRPYTGAAGGKLQHRSSALRRSIGFEVRGDGFASALTVFAGPPARIQEFGGRVTAKRAKYLTIPLRAALTPSGQPKRPGARDWEDTFVLRAKSGKLFIAREKGRKLELLYKLQQSVEIPARFGFRNHFRTRTLPFLRERLTAEVAKA